MHFISIVSNFRVSMSSMSTILSPIYLSRSVSISPFRLYSQKLIYRTVDFKSIDLNSSHS